MDAAMEDAPAEYARAGSLASSLLPEAVASLARKVEPLRFDALVDALVDEWAAAPEGSARVQRSLAWVSLVNWCDFTGPSLTSSTPPPHRAPAPAAPPPWRLESRSPPRAHSARPMPRKACS